MLLRTRSVKDSRKPAFRMACSSVRTATDKSFRGRELRGMPLDEQIARQITATDPTSRAIHTQRLEAEAKKASRPVKLPRRSR